MEQKKKIFGALDDLMRSPIGDRLRERVFRELSTKEIHDLLQREQKPYKELMAYYQCALMEVETKFRVLNEQFSLAHDRNPIESIKTRVKSLESITEKLNRRNLPFSTQSIEENLTDIAGIRIICSFREDIYFLADCLLEQDDITLIQRKDYIENPKENGYRSLHLIVEVMCSRRRQIRIASDDKPIEIVRSTFMKLDSEHIRFVMDSFKENTTDVRNIKQYLLASIYNAPYTIGSHYDAKVRHDETAFGGR